MIRIVFVIGAAIFGTVSMMVAVWGLEVTGLTFPLPNDVKLVMATLMFPAWAYAGWQVAKTNRL